MTTTLIELVMWLNCIVYICVIMLGCSTLVVVPNVIVYIHSMIVQSWCCAVVAQLCSDYHMSYIRSHVVLNVMY